MNTQTNAAVATQQQLPDRGRITYQVAGQDVTLSYQIVRDFLTKGNSDVSDQDLTQFISICKYNQLNPFLSEAYLIKFGTQPAQMIVSREALMKRAEACEQFEGIRGGIIIIRDGDIKELEGCFKLENDKLVGGWAEVHRKDRKFPIVARVCLNEYDKKQSTWNEKPTTMISKVAKVQALREAFPAQLGAMYTAEERSIQDVEYTEVTNSVNAEISREANKETLSIEPATVAPQQPTTEPTAQIAQPTTTSPRPVGQQPVPDIFGDI